MPPRERDRRRARGASAQAGGGQVPWAVTCYRAPDGKVPALDFPGDCAGTIDAQFMAVLDAVAAMPPPQFTGGGKWVAMHGPVGGWCEIRLTGPEGVQFRLFRLLENGTGDELASRGPHWLAIAVITGMRKPCSCCRGHRAPVAVAFHGSYRCQEMMVIR